MRSSFQMFRIAQPSSLILKWLAFIKTDQRSKKADTGELIGVFDDGYNQPIIDAAPQSAAQVPAGFLNALNADLPCDTAKRLKHKRAAEHIDKVKLRNEQIGN